MSVGLIVLGEEPKDLVVWLTRNGDFNRTLRRVNNLTDKTPVDWPDGAEIQLRYPGNVTWSAAITGPDAVFSEDKAVVNTRLDQIKASGDFSVLLFYIEGTNDLPWAVGEVKTKTG